MRTRANSRHVEATVTAQTSGLRGGSHRTDQRAEWGFIQPQTVTLLRFENSNYERTVLFKCISLNCKLPLNSKVSGWVNLYLSSTTVFTILQTSINFLEAFFFPDCKNSNLFSLFYKKTQTSICLTYNPVCTSFTSDIYQLNDLPSERWTSLNMWKLNCMTLLPSYRHKNIKYNHPRANIRKSLFISLYSDSCHINSLFNFPTKAEISALFTSIFPNILELHLVCGRYTQNWILKKPQEWSPNKNFLNSLKIGSTTLIMFL